VDKDKDVEEKKNGPTMKSSLIRKCILRLGDKFAVTIDSETYIIQVTKGCTIDDLLKKSVRHQKISEGNLL
jgi:hypothetical protein